MGANQNEIKVVSCHAYGEACNTTRVDDKADGSHQVCRRPYINKSDRSLRKTIVNVITPDGNHHNLVFVKYHFEGNEEHRVQVKPHGNSASVLFLT